MTGYSIQCPSTLVAFPLREVANLIETTISSCSLATAQHSTDEPQAIHTIMPHASTWFAMGDHASPRD